MIRSFSRHTRWIASIASAVVVAIPVACAAPSPDASSTAALATAPVLGSAQSFAVLAGSAVTNTGSTTITGDLGVSPGSAITGFPPGLVVGGVAHAADAVALQGQSDATKVYDALAGQACSGDLTGKDLGGLTLTAGVYCFSSSSQLTGMLTLDAEGRADAVFVFQIGSTLTTASSSLVRVINGGSPCNVYWKVGSSATLGTGTSFTGTIVSLTSITLTTGAGVSGRAWARNGAVTMDTNTISFGACMGINDAGIADATQPDGSLAPDGAGTASDASVQDATQAEGSGAADGAASGSDAGEDATSAVDACCDAAQCGSSCVDLSSDSNNCGSCGHTCGTAERCQAGVCCSD